MRYTVHKLFWAWEFDKEENWLNEMSAKGLQLVGVGIFRYIFEEGTPGEYCFRIELLEKHPEHALARRYIGFLEETGVEYIGNVLRWGYFRKKASKGPFDLFSDLDSRIKHLGKILALMTPALIFEFIIGAYNVWLYAGLSIANRRFYGNLISGSLCLILGLMIGYGVLKIQKKRRALIKERALHE